MYIELLFKDKIAKPPKPETMGMFDRIVEQKIKEGLRNGDFDDLEGKGKPIDLNKYAGIPAEKRMAYSIMMNNNIVPEEVELLQEIKKLKEQRATCTSKEELEKIDRQIANHSVRLQMLIEKAKLNRS